jgi:hypothetical protein
VEYTLMCAYDLTRLGDGKLIQCLQVLVQKERAATAELLAHIAEVDQRRLYVPAGYPSMYAYCVQELHLSEQAAYKRIQVGRAARHFPAIFEAIAEGRLHLSAVVLLAPHLTVDNAADLIASGTRKTRSDIELLLAQRFPKPDMPEILEVQVTPGSVGTSAPAAQLSPGIVGTPAPATRLAPGPVEAQRPKVKPLSPERFALQVTIDKNTHEKLRCVRELLSHQMPSGDLAQVLAFCLDAGLEKLEKRKYAATDRPRKQARKVTSIRTIPAQVKREVWRRDGGRCTFVSTPGRRCNARRFLEFDHIEPVGRGGESTLQNTRLRCRAHNQYEAECLYGAGFMHEKRERGRAGASP